MKAFFEDLIDYFLVGLAAVLKDFAYILIDFQGVSKDISKVEITNWPDGGEDGGEEPPPDDDGRSKRIIIVSVETPYYIQVGTRNGKPLIEKDFTVPKASKGTLLEAYVDKVNAIERDEGATAPILVWGLTRDLPGKDIRGLFINAGDAHIMEEKKSTWESVNQ